MMWLIVPLIGVLFVYASLKGIFRSWQRLQGVRRILAMAGFLLMTVGGFGFFSIPLVMLGKVPDELEWPIGRADQIIQAQGGLQVATHTVTGRIQVYDRSWHFLRAWEAGAAGGEFKARLTAAQLLEVWTERGEMRFVFDLDGRLVDSGSYVPASYADFQGDGSPGAVPIFPLLWIFSHPVAAWGVMALGMVMVAFSDPSRFGFAPKNSGTLTG